MLHRTTAVSKIAVGCNVVISDKYHHGVRVARHLYEWLLCVAISMPNVASVYMVLLILSIWLNA